MVGDGVRQRGVDIVKAWRKQTERLLKRQQHCVPVKAASLYGGRLVKLQVGGEEEL